MAVPETLPKLWQVFINFRGSELRGNFISHLERAFKLANIKYFIDTQELAGRDLSILLTRIKQSEIALSIFSSKYAESDWCLDELVKIMEQVNKKELIIIPVFFNVTPDEVRKQTGVFGSYLQGVDNRSRPNIRDWEIALQSVPSIIGLTYNRNEGELIDNIVHTVQRVLASSREGGGGEEHLSTDISSVSSNGNISSRLMIGSSRTSAVEYGMEQRLKDLEEKLDFNCKELTRIVGIVGMPGIGKTALVNKLYNKWQNRFLIKRNIRPIGEEPGWLKDTLLNGAEFSEKAKINRKIFLVLDDVSHKNQVSFLRENLKWIKKGSKIVVTIRDKSSITELVHDTYVVPGLNDKEAFKLFKDHAFNDQVLSNTNGNLMKLSEKFVDYAGGNPRALEKLGEELCGKDEGQWEERLETLPHCCNTNILTELRISYDKLSDEQKDAFLDIACFFRSEEEDYVKCLLESSEAVRDLAEKLFICISAGRVEMHNLLCTLGKELGSSHGNKSGERMWNHEKIINTLRSEQVTNNQQIIKVRGIFLDTSKVETGIPIDPTSFIEKFNKLNLRYLKIYDSLCPQQCEADCKVNLPDGLEFPFEEIRYFHWLKFPSEELPNFDPKNLMDLRLPYSKIERVWKAVKETPRLKWVDLSYSTKLTDLSALSNAFHLGRLNLEGCTVLDKLPTEMKNMKSLVYLNLKGCVMLSSLPEDLNLLSLKTLILSGCSNFNNFELTANNLEFIHLDGTAIESLPWTIQNIQKLVLLCDAPTPITLSPRSRALT